MFALPPNPGALGATTGATAQATSATTASKKTQFDVVTVARRSGAFTASTPDGGAVLSDADVSRVANAAIDQVARAGGGTVQIAAGDYALDSPIKMKAGVRLIGEGGLFPDYKFRSDYPTRLRSGARDLGAVVDMIEARGARLEHLVVDGAGKTGDCVKAAGYAIRVRDCVIKNAVQRGVWFTSGADDTHDAYVQGMAINTLFEDEPVGLEAFPDPAQGGKGGFTDGMVYQCRFTNCRDTGAKIAGGWQFLDNRLSGPGMATGVAVRGGYVMITNNVFESIAPGPAVRLPAPLGCVTGNGFYGIKKDAWIGVVADEAGGFGPKRGGRLPARNGSAMAAAESGPQQGDNKALESPSPAPRETTAESLTAAPAYATVYVEGGKCVAVRNDGAALESGSDAATVINAALRKGQPEGHAVVLVRAGAYLLNSPVRVPAGARLVGEGGMNDQGKTYHACGTILRAGAKGMPSVVDMTDAHEARLEQIAVDAAATAGVCVKMAGRGAQIRDCYLQSATDVVLWMTNGDTPGPDAYGGMAVIDTLIHSFRDATCLKVSKDPAAKGEAPSKGLIVNSRLMMGKVQGILAGGEGWRYVGIHATSGGGSTMGILAQSKGLRMEGSYFDTVVKGPHIQVEADDVAVVGCNVAAPDQPGRCIVVKKGVTNLTLTANNGQQVANQSEVER